LNKLKPIKYKKADFLLIAGDLTNVGLKIEMKEVLDLISSFEHIKHKIIVLGNHDSANPYNPKGMTDKKMYEWCVSNYPNLTFLDNEIVELDGVKIYGTPYVAEFGGWGFQYHMSNRSELTLPKEAVDIIVCHEPPSTMQLSYLVGVGDIGNRPLCDYLCLGKNKARLLVCGHVHELSGGYVNLNGCHCYNVAGKLTELVLKK
jgi:3',5'-cyclic AMP phosphodiesterase CpdA